MKKMAVLFLAVGVFLFLIHEGDCVEIVGGKEVIPHSRPYMAYFNTLCGGALIEPNWVLTAAHCDDPTEVTLGAHSRTEKEETKQKFRVHRIVRYPTFNLTSFFSDDIMLLQLNKNAVMNLYVSSLHLPFNGEDVRPGTECRVAGWGAQKYWGPTEDKLREVCVTVIDRDKCNSPKYYGKIQITKSMLCAGDENNGGKDSCRGDSGGPLLCKGYYRGIVSFGEGCGNAKKPGVYTLLTSTYLKWIKHMIQHYG
ncbi:granzyme A-like [Erpetoichthys calabaricus]|uniref:trypsin n=1 Tax=Erpetoichthys calabaricus TaxID=27687 RepID=A0A8C4RS33_ERPCA|nr:granzyme A-like [Erpetoichthys calabaricus]